MCVHLYGCMHMHTGVCGHLERVSDPLEVYEDSGN